MQLRIKGDCGKVHIQVGKESSGLCELYNLVD